jgi:hypothetical protein
MMPGSFPAIGFSLRRLFEGAMVRMFLPAGIVKHDHTYQELGKKMKNEKHNENKAKTH